MRLDLRKNTIIDKKQTNIWIFLRRRNDFCIRRLINSNLGAAKIVSSATNSASRVTSFPAVIGAYYLLSIQSTSNGLNDNSFAGCEIVYDYYAEMADTTPKVRSRTLLVKATAETINISCPSGHKGYYYAKITM